MSFQRICVFSLRNINTHVWRCAIYEFEDIISEIDQTDLLIGRPSSKWQSLDRTTRKVSPLIGKHIFKNTAVQKLSVNKNYEAFIFLCQQLDDLKYLRAIDGWKKKCKVSVCWVAEIWSSTLNQFSNYLNLLNNFDYVLLNYSKSFNAVQNHIKKGCYFLPEGIDAIKFCPYPNPPNRLIDVYFMGRRWQRTHQDLMELAKEKKIFYLYDTVNSFKTSNHQEHRDLLSNILQRTQYFIVSPAKFNEPKETQGNFEIPMRFYEGAASGTVMLGEFPDKNELKKKNFDWDNVFFNVPIDTPDIESYLNKFNSQTNLIKNIRLNNIVNSLLTHDWVYRWKSILSIIGLEPTPELIKREKELKRLSEIVKSELTTN